MTKKHKETLVFNSLISSWILNIIYDLYKEDTSYISSQSLSIKRGWLSKVSLFDFSFTIKEAY